MSRVGLWLFSTLVSGPRHRRGGFYFDGPTTWREGVVILGICPWWLSSGLVLQHLQLAKAPDNLNGGGDDGP